MASRQWRHRAEDHVHVVQRIARFVKRRAGHDHLALVFADRCTVGKKDATVGRERWIKRDIQQYYAKAFEVVSQMYQSSPPPPGMSGSQYERQHKGVQHLTEHFHEAPVWIVACIDHGGRPGPATGASIYPAVQNVLLAARALGLGATLTTRHTMFAAEVDAILGLPENVTALAIVPIGYPDRGFSRVRRGPIEEVVYQDRWGEPYTDLVSEA